jgi:hypothetical protein
MIFFALILKHVIIGIIKRTFAVIKKYYRKVVGNCNIS